MRQRLTLWKVVQRKLKLVLPIFYKNNLLLTLYAKSSCSLITPAIHTLLFYFLQIISFFIELLFVIPVIVIVIATSCESNNLYFHFIKFFELKENFSLSSMFF